MVALGKDKHLRHLLAIPHNGRLRSTAPAG